MRIDKLYIDDFKNIKDLDVNFDEGTPISVLIGKNGMGKSNLLEAIVIIFRDLDLGKGTKGFSYSITYHINGHIVQIENEKADGKRRYLVDGNSIPKSRFEKFKEEYLPQNVFAYYSGKEHRMEQQFREHQKKFYDDLLKNTAAPLRRLFYARDIHSNFVLLAFFAFFEETNAEFLKEYFSIERIESILFVMHKAEWAGSKAPYEKSRFWGARGVVEGFLKEAYDLALAPIKSSIRVDTGIKSTSSKEVIYLYLKNQKDLETLANKYGNNSEFFKYLESTYISDLIEEVIIKVRKTDGSVITFKELSEGEQQLLTVLGLLKFTEKNESLFLLDEPDTHLNPRWKFDYLNLLKRYAGGIDSESHIIISTHDPIVIGGLRKESVIVIQHDYEDKLVARNPEKDPVGMGVAAILTSDVFGVPSTLDPETQEKWDKERQLTFKKDKTADEVVELEKLQEELLQNGFIPTTRDPMYNKFLEKLYSRPEYKVEKKEWTEEEADVFDKLLDEIMEEEKNELH